MLDDIQLKKFILAISGFGGFRAIPKYTARVENTFPIKIYVYMWWSAEDKKCDYIYTVGHIETDIYTGKLKLFARSKGRPYSDNAKNDIIKFLQDLCDKYNNLKNKKEVS